MLPKQFSILSLIQFIKGHFLYKQLSTHQLTFVQDGVGWFVPGHRLLAEVLVGLGQTLHFAEAGVEGHGGVGGVLRHVEVGGTAQLLLDHQRLLQQLQGGRKEE